MVESVGEGVTSVAPGDHVIPCYQVCTGTWGEAAGGGSRGWRESHDDSCCQVQKQCKFAAVDEAADVVLSWGSIGARLRVWPGPRQFAAHAPAPIVRKPHPLPSTPACQAYCGDCMFCKHPKSNLCTSGEAPHPPHPPTHTTHTTTTTKCQRRRWLPGLHSCCLPCPCRPALCAAPIAHPPHPPITATWSPARSARLYWQGRHEGGRAATVPHAGRQAAVPLHGHQHLFW